MPHLYVFLHACQVATLECDDPLLLIPYKIENPVLQRTEEGWIIQGSNTVIGTSLVQRIKDDTDSVCRRAFDLWPDNPLQRAYYCCQVGEVRETSRRMARATKIACPWCDHMHAPKEGQMACVRCTQPFYMEVGWCTETHRGGVVGEDG